MEEIMQSKKVDYANYQIIVLSFIIFIFSITIPLYSQNISNDSTNNDSGDGEAKLSISAEGNIQGILTGSSSETTTQTGAIGVHIISFTVDSTHQLKTLKEFSEFSAKISIASSVDTIRNDFGGAILNPVTGSQSAYIEWRGRILKNEPWCNPLGWNLHFYGVMSSGIWSKDSLSRRTTTYAWGLSYFYDFINLAREDNPIIVRLDAGITERGVLGDITGDENKEFRESVFGSDKRNFFGFELGLTIQINSVKAFFSYLYLRSISPTFFSNEQVPGVTHGQVLAGINIRADIFQLTLSDL
jgi:hypothetical protein